MVIKDGKQGKKMEFNFWSYKRTVKPCHLFFFIASYEPPAMKTFNKLFTLYFILQIKLCSANPVNNISEVITFTSHIFFLVIQTSFHIYSHILLLFISIT